MSGQGVAQWLTALQAVWHRCRDLASSLLPQGLRAQLESGVAIVAIDLGGETVTLRRFADGGVAELARIPRAAFDAKSLRAALASVLDRPWFLRDSFALRLPDSLALRRNLSLPLAARSGLRGLLDIELQRQSPIDSSEVFHDYRILSVDRAAGRIGVAWRIVRRSSVKPALEICRQAGVDLAVVAFVGDDVPPDGGTFPVEPRASLLLGLRRRLVAGLLLLIAVLLAAIVAGAYARDQDAAAAFARAVEAARVAAQPSLQLEHAIAATRARAAGLLAEKRQPSVSRILAETTRILPNGSWLTDFAYRDGEVHIRGYSNAASSLIGRIDAAPLFAGAEFRAPLTQAQTPDQEQFDLAFKLRERAR